MNKDRLTLHKSLGINCLLEHSAKHRSLFSKKKR